MGAEAGVCEDGVEKEEGVKTRRRRGGKGFKGNSKLLDELCCYVVGGVFVCYYTDSRSVYFIVIDEINLKSSPPKKPWRSYLYAYLEQNRKGTEMREPEFYLIKLLRKAVHTSVKTEIADAQDDYIPESAEGADVYDMYLPDTLGDALTDDETSEEAPYLAMDYFDALVPKKIQIEEDINKFMDINTSSDNRLSKHEVAMQSIPIYCLAEDIEKHEHEISVKAVDGEADGKAAPYRNPFAMQNQYPYLSLVQIYIMPEIMARIEPVHEDEESGDYLPNSVTRGIINQFYEDIHRIIEDYAREHYRRDPFICRVYRSISAGDFTVAVGSNRPETAFILATLFRERGCYYPKSATGGKQGMRYVFFKTYTLLSCNKKWFGCNDSARHVTSISQGKTEVPEMPERKTFFEQYDGDFKVDGRFVLRMTFSNRYWANAAKDNSSHKYARLNGRYDFSVTLTENAFRYVSKTLYDYKLGSRGSEKSNRSDEEQRAMREELGEEFDICEELIEYIAQKGYVTYVNERYVFKCDNMDIFAKDSESSQTEIRLREETITCPLIAEINERALSRVKRRLDEVFTQVMLLDTNRRNMLYQLNLLRQMLNLCGSINGLSDTRIYCSILISQINMVLDGMQDCYKVLEEKKNRNFIPIMEHALAEAVESLNVFSKLIRDNNLQSLQTPNYNLESTVSMEKVLVGYGELLNSLFKWYEGTALCEEIFGLRQQYTPFVIPGNQDESLRTKVLFKEAKPTFPNEKLMVVWCSNFSDLTNFGGTVGILFHEVAHNLRYRGRAERNGIIVDYLTYLICDQITMSVIDNLHANIPELRESIGITQLICDSLFYTYSKIINDDRNAMRMIKEFSYGNVLDYIKNEYDKFTEVIRQINDVDRFIRQCISLRDEKNIEERDEALKRVRVLRKALVNRWEPAYKRRNSSIYAKEYEQSVQTYMRDAIAALEVYLQVQEDKNPADKAGFVDVSAKQIYESLLANRSFGDDFNQILPRYRLVDRFFIVLSEQLSANAEKLEKDGENKALVAEIGKVFMYLTRGDSYSIIAPSTLEAFISPHITKTRMEATEIMKQASTIYSEVCSDLFMYNLVEMTPFGYFSFLSEYAPSDARTAHTYIRRFCLVMYAEFSRSAKHLERRADKRRYWWGLMERLYNDFVLMSDKSLEAISDRCRSFDDMIQDAEDEETGEIVRKSLSEWCRSFRRRIVYYKDQYFDDNRENTDFFDEVYRDGKDSGEKDIKELFDAIEETNERNRLSEGELYEDLSKVQPGLTLEAILNKYETEYFLFLRSYTGLIYDEIIRSVPEGDEETKRSHYDSRRGLFDIKQKQLQELEILRGEMSRLGYMSFFLKRLYVEIHQEIVTLERLEYLSEDYRLGYYNTGRLHDEFVGSDGSDGCWMWPYFREIRKLLNHPERRYDKDIRKWTNTHMIEMVSELYYRAIRGVAEDILTDCE